MKKNKDTILYVVVPCYNEEEVLNETTKRLSLKLEKLISDKKISNESRIMYVNDGSKDKTWDLIEEYSSKNKLVTGICLSRNRGHQNALLAGLMTAKEYADVVISMDADLQDDIDAMNEMLDKYYSGCDIVYGVRSSRKKDSWFKKTTAKAFYKFMKIMGVEIIYNHADYRLTSKRVLNNLNDYKEVNLFLRGMFPLIGYKSEIVYYERNERFAGKTKYPLKKMLSFAWDGITSFSIKPIKMILTLGVLTFIVSLILMIYYLIIKLTGTTVNDVTFIICSIWLGLGLQLMSIGIVGEYIGKVYSEAKARPRYIISRNLNEENAKR